MLDQLTKVLVVANLSDEPFEIIGNAVELRLVRNSGAAFGLYSNATTVLAVLAILLTVLLARAVIRAADIWSVVALSLILGGALGNLIDRMLRAPGPFRGHVVDFVTVGSFPSFNLADSAITIGVILLLVHAFTGNRREASTPLQVGTKPL